MMAAMWVSSVSAVLMAISMVALMVASMEWKKNGMMAAMWVSSVSAVLMAISMVALMVASMEWKKNGMIAIYIS